MSEDRTLDDLSDEEYEDYQNNPEDYEDVTENTNEMYNETMSSDDEDE